MATFDDMLIEGKLTIYDKGFDEDTRSWGEYIARSGDTFSPRIPNVEPLRIECEHFLQCVRTGATPRSDGHSGLRVVRVLEALQRSLDAFEALLVATLGTQYRTPRAANQAQHIRIARSAVAHERGQQRQPVPGDVSTWAFDLSRAHRSKCVLTKRKDA